MTGRGARWLWLGQAVSGVLLVVLAGVHWIVQHYLAASGLRTYAEIIAYLRQPVALLLEITFLVVVTVHALLGVRAIIADLGRAAKLQRGIDACLWLAGIATVSYGIQLTWQVIHH